jgi:type I restriction enzyme, S subunit
MSKQDFNKTKENKFIKIRFDEICKNISDRITDPKQAKTDYYVGLEHLDSEDPKISRNGSPQDVGATKLKFKPGQILFGKRRWYLRKLAVAEQEGICSAHMMVLESINDKIKKDFLPLLMQGEDFFEKAISISAGSLSPTIKWKDLASLEFVIPLIPEQENILLIIHKIDDSIIHTQNLLEKTKNYVISRRESLLTKGIGHTKSGKEIIDDFGKITIPDDWKFNKLKDVTLKIKSGGTPTSSKKMYYGGNVPFVTIKDISKSTKFINETIDTITELGLKNSNAWMIPSNSILFSIYASIGKVRINKIPLVTHQGILGILVNSDEMCLDFLFYLLQHIHPKLMRYALKGTQGNLTKDIVENMKVAYPKSKLEMNQITLILKNMDNQINQQQSHLTNLKLLRKSILNSKLTNKKLIHKKTGVTEIV